MITAAERTLACMPARPPIADDRLVPNAHDEVVCHQFNRVLGEPMPPTEGTPEQRQEYRRSLGFAIGAMDLAAHFLHSAHPSRHPMSFGPDVLTLNRQIEAHRRLMLAVNVVMDRLEDLENS